MMILSCSKMSLNKFTAASIAMDKGIFEISKTGTRMTNQSHVKDVIQKDSSQRLTN